MELARISVLLVEDDAAAAAQLRAAVSNHGRSSAHLLAFELHHVTSVADAVRVLRAGQIEVVLLDLMLGDCEGLETLARIRDVAAEVPVVVLTQLENDVIALEAVRRGAQDYLVRRQVTPDLLVRTLRYAIERRRMERDLRDSEARLAAIVGSAMDGIVTVDAEMRVVLANRAAENMFGCASSELSGAAIDRFIPSLAPYITRAGCPIPMQPISCVARRANGDELQVDATISRTIASGWPLFTVIVRDVTERRRADEALRRGEAQLRQAQKMEAVGRLAGGIAHDFNNLLTIIRCSAELLLGNLGNRTEERAEAEEIKRTADRASRLTRQLLTFSRKELTRPELLGLDATIASSEELVRRLLLPDVTLVTVPGTGDAQVRTDRGQLEQALMNLAMNAREAMPHGGELVIETATVTLSDPLLHAHGIIRPGQYVTISVSDSGIGMTPEVQAHLFEPFFTTKSGSEASGLGLSTVYGIVQQSGGHIRVRSQAGQGSEFTIYLPLHAQVSGQAQPVAAAPSTPWGSETVLLVEDEPSIRTLVRRILTQRGYRVIEARHGGDALIRLQSTDEVIHLVITDAIMPEMGGRELIERLRVIRPALRTLVISGYTNGEFGDESEDAAFLSKPFTAAGLTNKVRELLDAEYAA